MRRNDRIPTISPTLKNSPEWNPRWALPRAPAFTNRSELDGLIQSGMKAEALQLARRFLKGRAIAPSDFCDALNAVLTLADHVRKWRLLVESAYSRLPKGGRAAVRFWMMAIRNACGDHEAVLQLMPRRFIGEHALLEVIYCMDAVYDSGDRELMKRLAPRLRRFAWQAEHPMTQGQLLLCLAEFLARLPQWKGALQAAEAAQQIETFHQNAIFAIVEIYVARAIMALRRGFHQIDQFNKNLDPETELILPGNDRRIQEQAAKELRRLERILERIVPKERQKELGMPSA